LIDTESDESKNAQRMPTTAKQIVNVIAKLLFRCASTRLRFGLLSGLIAGSLAATASVSLAQVSANTAASQSMKFTALSESEKLLQNLQTGDSTAIVAKCAPRVDYENKGKISARPIRSELEKYFNRWSNRQYSHLDTTLIESDFDEGIYRVRMDFDWSVSDAKNGSKSGRSRIELAWKGTTNENLSIVMWKEHRLH
jgi:hypothetical protein